MNPFLLSSSERLAAWRDFRSKISGLEETEQLNSLATWAGQIPTVTFSLDFDDPASWPTPWELIHENRFCSTGVAYLMEQTLIMMGWNPDRLKLIYMKNSEDQAQTMILVVDDTWVLNYSIGELFNFDTIRSGSALLAVYKAVDGGHVGA